MRLGVITKYIGNSLLLVAAAMGVAAGVSGYYGFDDGFAPLLYSCILTAIIGAFPNIFVRGGQSISRSEGYFIVVGSWMACCLFGTMPYLMFGGEFSPVNALFETISGFTTTGASILTEIESLPKGMIFWRMSTAWIGGIGIIALFSLFIPSAQKSDTTLNSLEMSSIARAVDGLKPRSFVHTTIIVYIILTIFAVLSLKLAGMDWFDATTHAMSACSTCGFSTRNASIASFDSVPVESVLIFFMLLSSLRFSLICVIVLSWGRRLCRLNTEVTRAFLLGIVGSAAVLSVGLYLNGNAGSFFHCVRLSIFQVASIFTTTGFATADTNIWPSLCTAILLAGSLVCGCSGSTSGGIKTDRAVVAWKCLKNTVLRVRRPNLVTNVVVDGRVVKNDACMEIMLFIVCYGFVILVGTLLNTSAGLDLKTAGTAAVACMGNVGPGLGSIGTMGNYSSLPLFSKCVSMALMVFGRLEIFPIIFVLRRQS